MALSPDDIERRTFAVRESGYDADEVRKFLFEVAAVVRLARHTTALPPSLTRSPSGDATRWPVRGSLGSRAGRDATASAADASTDPAPADPEMPDLAASSRTQAEARAAEIREDALHDAAEIRRKAEADAALEKDRAKRVLTTAQAQASAIIADAEAHAQVITAAAASFADDHMRETMDRTRRQADEILRVERDTIARLQAAQTDVGRAIESIARADTSPITDLHRPGRSLRFGVPSDLADDTMVEESFSADALSDDPVVQMVRTAVDRAVTAAASSAGPDAEPAIGTEGGDDPAGATAPPPRTAAVDSPVPASRP